MKRSLARHWDIFIDERKDGGHISHLGFLVFEVGVTEGILRQLLASKNRFSGARLRVGEVHWSDLGDVEAKLASAWLSWFLRGPLMFFVLVRNRGGECKREMIVRTLEALEQDPCVNGGLDRLNTTLHLDLDSSDDQGLLRSLRRDHGVLRAFAWDSKGSLLLQLADVLLGVSVADQDGSLRREQLTRGTERQLLVLESARTLARHLRMNGKHNAVIAYDANRERLLVGPQTEPP